MAVMKMVALTMVGPHAEMEEVARQMVLTGGFQPLPIDILVNDRTLRSKVTTETENPYDELLAKVSAVWKVAGEQMPQSSPVALTKDFTLARARAIVNESSKRLSVWERRRDILIEEKELLTAAKILLEALDGLAFTPNELASGTYAVPFFGRISSENLEKLADSSEEAPVAVVELTQSDANSWIIVITAPGYKESARKLLDAVYFKDFSLHKIAGDIEAHILDGEPLTIVERRIANHQRAIKGLSKAARDMLREQRDDYEQLYFKLYTMQRVYDLCKGRGEISGMFLLSGWIPEDTLSEVRRTIEQDAPMTMILIESAKDISFTGIRVPTLLKNNRFFRAFQEIVSLYSLPSYGEIDPSPIVAITFTLFFGFMFGDVGHGLLIFLGAYFLVRKGVMRRSYGHIIKIASVSSMIFGVLYGSIFGMEGIFPPLWLSPMHDTNKLLTVAICLGVFMISLGLILNMVKQFLAKDFGRLLFDGSGLAGLALYWTMAILAAVYITDSKISDTTANYMWAAVGILLLVMAFKDVLARYLLRQKRHNESAVMNIFEIIHSLLGFVSNTASFVRLAAFALNHVGLSMAVIMLSEMVHNMPGGIVMKGIILILGNLLIVCLEGLIVFIQTLRLEYYEFFGKFYRGGGSAFKPIGWNKEVKKTGPALPKN